MKKILKIALIATLIFGCLPITHAEQQATKIVVYKAQRKMVLLDGNDDILKIYRIGLSGKPKGKKTQAGDKKTPEGLYYIEGRNPDSQYYKSLKISYPNADDRANAARLGVSPGGDITIHGLRKGAKWLGPFRSTYFKWTQGCIAVTNNEMDELWQLVPDGTPIEIKP